LPVLNAVSRYASTPEELVLALTEDGYEARGDTLTAQADAERVQLLAAIEILGSATFDQLSEDTGLARTTVQRHVSRLLEDGAIDRQGKG
jgi:DNA-binding transcriptional ArsR family regulator